MAKFNHTAHKELWDWLARNPDKEKDDWPGWIGNGGEYYYVVAECFACEYDLKLSDTEYDECRYCPLWRGVM